MPRNATSMAQGWNEKVKVRLRAGRTRAPASWTTQTPRKPALMAPAVAAAPARGRCVRKARPRTVLATAFHAARDRSDDKDDSRMTQAKSALRLEANTRGARLT